MHIFLHQGHRYLAGGSVWRLFDHIFVDGSQAENPHGGADSDRFGLYLSVGCMPTGARLEPISNPPEADLR